MKKIFLFISPLIAFFLGGFLLSFKSYANAMPSIDSSVFTTIASGNDTLIDVGFLPQNLVPYGNISTSSWSPWNIGYFALSSVDENDCNISILNDSQKSELINTIAPIHVNGASVTVSENIYCVEYDNGYFSGYCYIDDSGKLLAYSDSIGGHLLQLKYGGSVKDTSDWADMFQETSTDIRSDQFLLTDHPEYVTDFTYYIFEGTLSHGNPDSAYDLYIPNQYQPGVIVPTQTRNGYSITEWYLNGLDSYIFHTRYGTVDENTRLTLTSGTFTKDGISYTKKLTLNRWNASTTANNDFFDWLNGQNKLNTVFGAYGLIYNTQAQVNSGSSVAFKPIQNPNGAQVINYNYFYDYNSIQDLESQLNNLQNELNNNFDYQSQLSDNNFPYYYPIGNTEISPSEIPFPGVENYPGFEPLPTPTPNPMPDPATAPSIGSDIGEVDPTDLRSTIPIINNLLNRFPFSIPWDIYGLLSGLSVERETPYINTTIHIPGINYDWVLDYDLSEFDGIASLFRTLFLIAFILGLAYFSYDHFFGS